jgi:thioesterase domain-containing protein
MTASPDANTQGNTAALFARASRNSNESIVPINDIALRKDAPNPAFYCIHSVSGVAGADFLALARRLEPAVRFYGLQAPPKQMEIADFGGSIESLANYYADALVEFQKEGPLLVGGYCIGAVIALEVAKNLRTRGREVGPVIAIDGAPENTGAALGRWKLRYWWELARNLPGWISHADLMRSRSLRSLMWSISNNTAKIRKGALGLKWGQRPGGGFAMDDLLMDLSRYPPAQQSFINRLFSALWTYVPGKYPGEVIVYEAEVTQLLYLPQIARVWRHLAPKSEVVNILGTHIGMMREPYVDALANDMRRRLTGFFSHPARI